MNATSTSNAAKTGSAKTNGAGAAATLAAGLGSFTLGILTVAGDKFPAFRSAMNFYRPTGPLSGVSILAITVWIITWLLLHALWSHRDVAMKRIAIAAFLLLAASLLFTFPPFIDAI